MASGDRKIGDLTPATTVTEADLMVLEQSGTPKKLTGQVLISYLLAALDGHGGIKSLVPTKEEGLNVTYTITFTDGATTDIIVKNGEKGDPGDTPQLWIKYAANEPTEESYDMSDLPDKWIGLYPGFDSTAPSDWKKYTWYQFQGDKGETGDPATLESTSVTYQVGDYGNIVPIGSWSKSIPVVAQGKYLWTRIEVQFNSGNPITAYTVTRMGLDGMGSVSSVAGISPDEAGNVPLTAENVKALPITGGTMAGPINMGGSTLSGINNPEENADAANKGYTLGLVKNAAPRTLLDNSNFLHPINQRGKTIYTGAVYGIDRWTGMSRTQIELGVDGIVLRNTSPAAGFAYWQQIIPVEKFDPARDSEKYYTIVAKINGTVYVNSGTGAGFVAYFGELKVLFVYFAASGMQAVRLEIPEGDENAYTIEWIDLYEGEYTAETYPEHKPSGNELCTCLQYCRKLNAGFMFRADVVSANTLQFMIPLGIAMRVVPSIESGELSIVSLAGVAVDGFSITISMAGNGFVRFLAAKTAHGLSDAALRVESDVILSADL